MPELFISYSSQDRPWAERLFNDLRRDYPTTRPFLDRESIPAAANWGKVLEENARKTTHFVVLWSEYAKQSNQVGPEIEAFRQSRDLTPRDSTGAERKLFYVPLEGAFGPLELTQGFPDFKPIYSSSAVDRGLGSLEDSPHSDNWRRLVRRIGDTILDSEATKPVQLAVLAMNEVNFKHAETLQDEQIGTGPTLNEFLAAYGLTLQQARARYGANAYAWKPFGGSSTIIELMEELRMLTHRDLNAVYQSSRYNFHWVPIDFVQSSLETRDETALRRVLSRLDSGPSVVVVDAISLYNPIVVGLFKRLHAYATQRQSVIIGVAPTGSPAINQLYQSLSSNGSPVLDSFFRPPIPAVGAFALCCLNVGDVIDMERLILGSLSAHHRRSGDPSDKALLSLGVSA
jgi:hypothetical protein